MKARIMLCAFIATLGLMPSQAVYAFNIYRVGEVVVGREYNEVWKRWLNKKFTIWVGVDEDKKEYIFFKADTGLGDATVSMDYTAESKDKLENAILKAIEWSEVARKNNADATKSLGCFGYDAYSRCERGGEPTTNQMVLSFFAANGGKQTDLIVRLVDRDNQFVKASIYIEPLEVKKLLQAVRGIDSTFKKARDTANKQDLFK